MKRFLLIVLVTLIVFVSLFLVGRHWGFLAPEAIRAWLEGMQESGAGRVKVALVLIGLMGMDLFFPVPSSLVMALAGMFYGAFLGAVVAFAASMFTAVLGFAACRLGGQVWVRRIVGEEDIERVGEWFERYGVFAIVISRPIPMLTEVISCLAGMSAMRVRTFLVATAVGHLPVCVFYSFIGSKGDFADPWPVIAVSLAVPALIGLAYRWWSRRHDQAS